MPEFDSLLEYLQATAGDSLRAVGMYDTDRTQLLYHRNDLDPELLRERQERIVENITWEWQPPEGDLDDELGSTLASLQIREDAVVLHLPVDDGDDRGILIGLEPDAARNLTRFIVECLTHVRDTQSVA